MKPELLHTQPPPGAKTDARGRDRFWVLVGVVLLVLVAGQLAMYAQTTVSIVRIWNRSQTYTHGWIIGPISLYLIWLRRDELRLLLPHPSVLGALVWAALNLLWLIGHVAGALVVSQYALVAMIPALVWALLGTRIAWMLAFPLFFLLLAVPSGEAMVPGLIDFTADFTVKALQLTGIPVYREGTFFSVPTGDWSVVEACSGIRYLIASFTGGCLFAYLYYRSTWKRLILVLASIIVPIVGNGLRAYMIVMIGHLSKMRLAVGVDHVIYGWVFFGVLMFGLFWIASIWREQDALLDSDDHGTVPDKGTPSLRQVLVMGLVLGVAAGALRVYTGSLDRAAMLLSEVNLNHVPEVHPWTEISGPVTRWEPFFGGYDRSMTQGFVRGTERVQLRVLYYRGQSEGRELITSMNRMSSTAEEQWRVIGQRNRVELDGKVRVLEVELKDKQGEHLLVWHWMVIDGREFTNPFLGKVLQAMHRIVGHTGEGAAVFVVAPHQGPPGPARETLQAFVSAMNPGILATLEQAKGH